MPATKTEIANLAISHLGIGKEIADLDTENSEEANACRRYYTTAREEALRDFDWPFTTKFADLSLVTEDPVDEWKYSYSYPADCLKLRRITSGQRRDTHDTRVPFKIINVASGLQVYTDEQDACAEYTLRATDEALFPSDFAMALSFRLAAYVASRLTHGDDFRLSDRAFQLYEVAVTKAQSNAGNEVQDDVYPEAEFMRTRE